MNRMTDEELDGVAGGATDGGVAGVKGIRSAEITTDELDAVSGGATDGGVAGVKG